MRKPWRNARHSANYESAIIILILEVQVKLQEHDSMTVFTIGYNEIYNDGLYEIAESLKYWPLFTHLDVEKNEITYNGIKALARILRDCRKISILNKYDLGNVSMNETNAHAAKEIYQALKSHRFLTSLKTTIQRSEGKSAELLNSLKHNNPSLQIIT